MDFTTIKDMSIGNLKIKEIWYNNNILYQDNAKRDLTLIQMGEVTFNNIYNPPIYTNLTDTLVVLEMGQTTNNNQYIAPITSVISGDNITLIQLAEV